MFRDAIELIEALGFCHKTVAFHWVKLNRNVTGSTFCEKDFFTGMGHWTRANAKQCLLATIGRPKRISKSVRRLIVFPRREYSRKPDEAYDRIESLLNGPNLELFARNSRPGWTVWGDRVDLFDRGPVQTRRFPSTHAYNVIYGMRFEAACGERDSRSARLSAAFASETTCETLCRRSVPPAAYLELPKLMHPFPVEWHAQRAALAGDSTKSSGRLPD